MEGPDTFLHLLQARLRPRVRKYSGFREGSSKSLMAFMAVRVAAADCGHNTVWGGSERGGRGEGTVVRGVLLAEIPGYWVTALIGLGFYLG